MTDLTTFTYTEKRQSGANGTIKFAVQEAKFGDGYTQRAQDGINGRLEGWDLTFTDGLESLREIRDFLDALNGASAFYWTPPGSTTQGVYLMDNYQYKMTSEGSGIYTLTVTFQQIAAL